MSRFQFVADHRDAFEVKQLYTQDKAYGAPRVTAELKDGAAAGDRVNHKRIARVMRQHGLAGLRLRRRVRTTIPEPSAQKVREGTVPPKWYEPALLIARHRSRAST